MTLDSNAKIILHNYVNGELTNLVSASTYLTGSDCLKLKIQLPISVGLYINEFSASSVSIGTCNLTGIYSSSFILSSTDNIIMNELNASGSLKIKPIWCSLDNTLFNRF